MLFEYTNDVNNCFTLAFTCRIHTLKHIIFVRSFVGIGARDGAVLFVFLRARMWLFESINQCALSHAQHINKFVHLWFMFFI